jgi:phospholipase C
MSALDEIDTIVVVMMENRSFDHVVGHLHHPLYGNRADIDGLDDPATTAAYDNPYLGAIYKPFASDDGMLDDPPHSRTRIATQMDVVGTQAKMDGFAEAFAKNGTAIGAQPSPMAFLTPDAVPVCDFFAAEYLVCNRYHSSVPASTQPNRSVAYCGTTLVDDNVTGIIPHRKFIFDWLDKHGVRWRVYHSGLSFFLLFGRFLDALGPKFHRFHKLAHQFRKKHTGTSPQVVFIEPEYEDSPVHFGLTPSDDHSPLAMAPGENFLRTVYTALTSNPDRWARTMLIVTFDEHGGFYDHVAPPRIGMGFPPGAKYAQPFESLGVRVPTFVVSPWVDQATVSNGLFDHTSILQLFAEKFTGNARGYSQAVNHRIDLGVESLSTVLTRATVRPDVPPAPAQAFAAMTMLRAGVKPPETENQLAFAEAVRALVAAHPKRALDRFPELALLPDGLPRPESTPRQGRKPRPKPKAVTRSAVKRKSARRRRKPT